MSTLVHYLGVLYIAGKINVLKIEVGVEATNLSIHNFFRWNYGWTDHNRKIRTEIMIGSWFNRFNCQYSSIFKTLGKTAKPHR